MAVMSEGEYTALPTNVSYKQKSISKGYWVLLGVLTAGSILGCLGWIASHSVTCVPCSKGTAEISPSVKSGDGFVDLISLSVKTGVTIAGQRIAYSILADSNRNIPKRIYYADTNFTLGNVKVHDAYSDTSDEIRHQPIFQTYFQVQKDLQSNYVAGGGHEYWALSRYIDTHIQGLAYKRDPNKDWFMTSDDDTFIFWGTFLRWLRTFNPKEQVWLGHYDNNAGTIFANGGGAYIVSGKMMRDVFGSDPLYATRNPELYLQYDAGDTRLGKAWTSHPNMKLKRPSAGDPSINNEKPRWITYSPLTWYLPVLTLGHMDPQNSNMVRQAEIKIASAQGREDDIRFCDIYNEFVPKELSELQWSQLHLQATSGKDQVRWLIKKEWRANPRFVNEQEAPSTLRCQEMCEEANDCHGFTYYDQGKDKNCHLYRLDAFTFGERQKDVTSAWDLQKIRKGIGMLDCANVDLRKRGWEESIVLNPVKDMVT